MDATPINSTRRAWLECIPLCLIYLAARLPRLDAIALFFDEAVYLRWAQQIVRGDAPPTISLEHGIAPGLIWLAAPLVHWLEDPLLAGRLAAISAGLATLVAVHRLAFECAGVTAARRAAILFAVCPMFVVYDRLALYEGPLAAAAAGLWAFAARYLNRPGYGSLAGVLLSAAVGILIKSTMLVAIMAFVLGVTFVTPWRRAAALGSAALAGVALSALALSPWTGDVAVQNARAVDGLIRSLANPLDQWIPLLGTHGLWLLVYLTPLPVLIVLLGVWGRSQDSIRRLAIALGIEYLALAVLVPRDLANPRYLVILGPLFVVLAALVLARDDGPVGSWLGPRARMLVFYGTMVMPCAVNAGLLLAAPARAILPATERFQLITGWPSGHGIAEIARLLQERHPDGDLWVYAEGTSPLVLSGLQLYLPPDRVQPIDPRRFLTPDQLFESPPEANSYLVTHEFQYMLHTRALERIAEFPKPGGMYVMRLYRVRAPLVR